jgi:hypothetical protein
MELHLLLALPKMQNTLAYYDREVLTVEALQYNVTTNAGAYPSGASKRS